MAFHMLTKTCQDDKSFKSGDMATYGSVSPPRRKPCSSLSSTPPSLSSLPEADQGGQKIIYPSSMFTEIYMRVGIWIRRGIEQVFLRSLPRSAKVSVFHTRTEKRKSIKCLYSAVELAKCRLHPVLCLRGFN